MRRINQQKLAEEAERQRLMSETEQRNKERMRKEMEERDREETEAFRRTQNIKNSRKRDIVS